MKAKLKCLMHRTINMLSQCTRILPLKKRKIVCYSSNNTTQYADSPMYITEYLLNEYPGEYEVYWIADNPSKFDNLISRGIRPIRHRSLSDLYHSNTASVYITNMFGHAPYVVKRAGKLIIETTHGVAYKSLVSGVFDSTANDSEKKWAKAYFSWRINQCDLCLSGSRITSEVVLRKELGYRGEILEVGLPRNDVFFSDAREERESTLREFGLAADTKIALFMPTWRKGNGRANIEIDYSRFVEALHSCYGGKWVAMLRLHPLSNLEYDDILTTYSDCLVDATGSSDPQSLLSAADLLVTDYSSVIWDFALLGRPIVLFQPDLGDYEDERGFNVPPEEWELPVARTSDGLINLFQDFDYESLCAAASRHLARFGSYETGHATEDVCKIIHGLP